MVPSSAPIRAPTRPTSTRAVTSGPSSVSTLAATMLPITQIGTLPVNWYPLCCDVTAPESAATTVTTGMLRMPMS